MKDSVFLDTNILVFGYSYTELKKQRIARKLIAEQNSYISTQVLQELANTLTRKFKFSHADAIKAIEESRSNNIVHINTEETILQACKISSRFGYSFYDSMIIASALECNCRMLYSEDLHHGHVIDKKLKIINPFI